MFYIDTSTLVNLCSISNGELWGESPVCFVFLINPFVENVTSSNKLLALPLILHEPHRFLLVIKPQSVGRNPMS